MKSEQILDALGGIDDRLILDCLPLLTACPKRRRTGQKLAMAACLALLLLGAGKAWLYLNELSNQDIPALESPTVTEDPVLTSEEQAFAEKLWAAPDPDEVGDGAKEAFLAYFEENPDLLETYENYDLSFRRSVSEGREIAVLKCDGPLMASTGESQCFWYYYDDGTVTFGPSGVWSPETVDYAEAVRRMLTERSPADTADYDAYVREAFTGYYMEHEAELRQLSQYDEVLGNGRSESDYAVYYRLDELQETSEPGIYQASFSGMEFLWTDLNPGYDSPASENLIVLDQWCGGAAMDVPEAIRMVLTGSQSLQETGFTVSDSLTVTFRLQKGEHPFQYLSCVRESPQDVLEKMKEILMEDTPFLDVGLGEKIHIQELNRVVSSDASIDVAISSFTVIDLDEDGIDEVILWLAAGEEKVGCEILHGVNDEIYGYFIPYRGFYNLKADGTFRFSSGAGNSGIGTIKFDLQAYTVEKITYSETQYDERNQAEASFVVNGHASLYEDFEAEMEKQDEKKDAETYAFTDDHVEKYLS